MTAAKLLVEEGKVDKKDFPFDSDGYKDPQTEFIDDVAYDGRKPNEYLSKFDIGLKSGEGIQSGKVVKNARQ